MKRKIFAAALGLFSLAVLLISTPPYVSPGKAVGGAPPGYKTLTVAEGLGNFPATLDPANCYDSPSAELISNIYETLIAFDGESVEAFRPQLATQVTVAPPDSGSPSYTLYTIYFQVRTGVYFVNSCRTDYPLNWATYPLTTADVEYSLERVLVHDYQGGPSWTLAEPLLSTHQVTQTMGTIIDDSVESNSTHVWINVANYALAPFASTAFTPVDMFIDGGFNPNFWASIGLLISGYNPELLFQALAQPWCSIISEQWVINYVNVVLPAHLGCAFADWDGTWPTWATYLSWTSKESPLDKWPYVAPTPGIACGTGPYILDIYYASSGWSCVRNTAYWGPWPASGPNPPYPNVDPSIVSSGIHSAGYVTRLTVVDNLNPAWRVSGLISGTCDLADIPRLQASGLHAGGNIYGATLAGIRLNYPIYSIKVESLHFTWNIASDGGLYGIIGPPSTFSAASIPSDFFEDIHIRYAFANLINFTWIINTLMLGEAYQPTTCAPTMDQSIPHYGPPPDLTNVAGNFSLAFGGAFMAGPGFSLTIPYDAGNTVRAQIAAKLASDLNSFPWPAGFAATVTTIGVPWPTYSKSMKAHELPLFLASWVPDKTDVIAYMLPYMGNGVGFECGFAYDQQYPASPTDLGNLDLGLRTPDGPVRASLLWALRISYYLDTPSVPLYVPYERGYMRSWVAGHYYNPLSHGVYAYDQWKWNYLRGNVDYNKFVNMGDLANILNAFGSYIGKSGMPVIQDRWNFHCDIDGNPQDSSPPGDGGWRDRKIDMYDVSACLDNLFRTDTVWVP